MTNDIERLREGFRERPLRTEAEDCPGGERLWDAARGGLPPREVEAIVLHTAHCAVCAAQWRFAADLARDEAPATRVSSRFPRAALALAAAAIVVAVAGLALRDRVLAPGPGEIVLREGAEQAIADATGAHPLSRQAAVLRWSDPSAVPGATRYEIEVGDDDLDAIASARGLAEPAFEIPASALAALPPGATLHWRVVAVDPGGSRRRSPTFSATLAR